MKKKIYLLIILCSAAGWVHADWSRIDHNAKEVSLYVDSATRQDSGRGSVLLWHLVDFNADQDFSGKPFRSIKGQDEYDCEKGVRRDLFHLWHQDSMGASAMVHVAYTPGPWTSPVAGSVEQTLMRLVCSK
jgi:hypothetical protein